MNQLQQKLVQRELEELRFFHEKWKERPPKEPRHTISLTDRFIDFLSHLQKLEGIETEEYHSGKGIRAEHIRTGLFACEHASGDKNEEVAVSELLKLLEELAIENEMKSDFRGSYLLYP